MKLVRALALLLCLLLAHEASAAIVREGTYSNNCASTCRPTGAHSLADVTIPAAATYGVFAFGYFEVGGTLSSLTLNSQAGAVILSENSDACCYHVTLVYFPTPSSGSSLTLAWSNGSDFDDGVNVVGAFYSGGDISSGTTSLIRSSGGESGNNSATTASLTAVSSDVIAMGYAHDPGTPSFTNGTSVVSVAGTTPTTGMVEYAPSGNTTMDITATGLFPVVVAAVMIATSSVVLEQEGFRWGVDDANEASHTFEAAQDTNISITDNQSRLLRALVNATLDPASTAYTLRYQKNGAGGYAAVPVGTTSTTSITNQNVAASADDGQDIGGTNTITGTTIGASLDATTEWAGMRFTNITIPVGATITAASVGVVPSGTGEDEPLVTIFLEAADSCAAFTTGASNISSRSLTASVAWSSANLGASGSDYWSTPDLTTPFQAVINRAGWASGNAVCVLIQGGSTSTRDLTIEAQDLGPNTNPPRLSVTWTTPNQVYVTTSANITAGGEATTARLTAPAGKSTSDFVTGRRWDDENGTDTIDITTDDYTEVEWLTFIASSAANDDFFDFRVYAGSSALNTYTVTPRWTIPGAGGTVVNPISGRGGSAASPVVQ